MQIFIRSIVDGSWIDVSRLSDGPITSAADLKDVVSSHWGLCDDEFSLRTNRSLAILESHHEDAFPIFVDVFLALRGGKGGFGSLLRGQSARLGHKKSSDNGACRDLNGRRLRHVNAERELTEWYESQRKKEAEKKDQNPKRKAEDLEAAANLEALKTFDSSKFREVQESTITEVSSAVQAGLMQFKARTKKKAEDESVPKKRAKFLADIVPELPAESICPTESSDETSVQSDEHSTSTTRTSSTFTTIDSSMTIATSATTRTRLTATSAHTEVTIGTPSAISNRSGATVGGATGTNTSMKRSSMRQPNTSSTVAAPSTTATTSANPNASTNTFTHPSNPAGGSSASAPTVAGKSLSSNATSAAKPTASSLTTAPAATNGSNLSSLAIVAGSTAPEFMSSPTTEAPSNPQDSCAATGIPNTGLSHRQGEIASMPSSTGKVAAGPSPSPSHPSEATATNEQSSGSHVADCDMTPTPTPTLTASVVAHDGRTSDKQSVADARELTDPNATLAKSTASLNSSATLLTAETSELDSTVAQVSSNRPRVYEPIDLTSYGAWADLLPLGGDHLKCELQRVGLKCGGTAAERAQRLWLLKSCPLEKIDAKHLAKKAPHK
eukprot:TRINITY_DN84_c0_g1_i1.p1 TRINITY_DN84_c0_g1~~TRINITY_DN84_c0_g1_i1.p1  ORF type:complete len:612 (+),score=161.01 TRINITY_DN84_c0_g1_i1:47-1882(+)